MTDLCGIKNARGEPCVLPDGHDPDEFWPTRTHETAAGTSFTWRKEAVTARRHASEAFNL